MMWVRVSGVCDDEDLTRRRAGRLVVDDRTSVQCHIEKRLCRGGVWRVMPAHL